MPDLSKYPRAFGRTHRVLALVLGVVFASACSDQENSVQPVQRAFKLSVPMSPVTIYPGREIRTGIVIERIDGFAGSIELRVSDVPNGMTATIMPSTGAIAVLVLNTSPAMPTGPATVTIVGTASGAEEQSVALIANVDIGTFVVVPESPMSVRRGGSAETRLLIERGDPFQDSVALSVSGAPPGMTAVILPPDHTYGTATLVITTSADAELGTVPLVITGAAERHANKTFTYLVTVLPEGGGNVSVTFAGCGDFFRPVWFAAQDGSGPWTQVVASNDVYQFNVKSAKAGYAFVLSTGYRDVRVAYASSEELTRSPILACGRPETSNKTVYAQFAGIGAKDVTSVGLGGHYNVYRFEGPPFAGFALEGIPLGPQDFIAYRDGRSSGAASVVIRRDLNVPDKGSLGTVNFASDEAFAPVTAPVRLTGFAGSPGYYMSYFAGADCSYYDLYDLTDAWKLGSQFDMSGIPANQQRPGDFHQISVYDGSTGANQSRSVTESFHALAPRTIDMPDLPTPSVLFVSGPYTRLQATIARTSAETSAQLRYFFREFSRLLTVDATSGWLAQTATLTVPDFSAVSGWQKDFLADPAERVSWHVSVTSSNDAARGGNCVEGARWTTISTWGVR